MATSITPEQLRAALDEATERKVAHFNKLDWLPEWTQTKPELQPTLSDAPKCSAKPLNCVTLLGPRIKTLQAKFPDDLKHVRADREAEDPGSPDEGNPLTKMPHSGADFSHVDEGVYSQAEKQDIRDGIRVLKDLENLARKDGELNRAVQDAIKPLNHADGLLEVNPKGMQRLKLVFEWTLCQVTTVYGEINAALDNPDPEKAKAEYNAARAKYIALLHDLDDHEPQTKGEPKAGETGYGRALKWAYFLPLIHEGRIKGAKIVAKWNPHISSSGIPIPHK